MLSYRLAATFIVAALVVSGCRVLVPVTDISNAPYSTGGYQADTVLGLTDYERAIVRAGANRGWQFASVSPGLLEGNLDVRGKHFATVQIPFTTESYSINYKASKGLKYDSSNNQIHPNYNSWIKLLDGEIKKEVQRLQAS